MATRQERGRRSSSSFIRRGREQSRKEAITITTTVESWSAGHCSTSNLGRVSSICNTLPYLYLSLHRNRLTPSPSPSLSLSINRPGGHGKITKVHADKDGNVLRLDVKYTLSGADCDLDPELVQPYVELDRKSRRSRTPFAVTTATKTAQKENKNRENINVKLSKRKKQKEADKKNAKKTATEDKAITGTRKTKPPPVEEVYVSSSFKHLHQNDENVDDTVSVISELGFGAEAGSSDQYHDSSDMLPPPQRQRTTIIQRRRQNPISASNPHNQDATDSHSPISRALSMGSGMLAEAGITNEVKDVAPGSSSSKQSASKLTSVSHKSLFTGQYNADRQSNKSKRHASERGKQSLSAIVVTQSKSASLADRHGQLPRHDLSLHQVHQADKIRASSFCQQVIRNASGGIKSSTTETAVPDRDETSFTVTSFDAASKDSTEQRRCKVFISVFQRLLEQSDGMMEEDSVTERVNTVLRTTHPGSSGDPCFSSVECDEFLQHLAKQNKVMLSDGLVYSI